MSIEIEEKSLSLALMKAAGSFGVTREHINYSIIKESSGFLGLFGKKIKIKAWQKSSFGPKKKLFKANSFKKNLDNKTRRTAVGVKEKNLQQTCQKICSIICDEEVSVKAEWGDRRVVFDVDHDYIAEQIAQNSRFSDALEHILGKSQKKESKQTDSLRIFVDSNGVRSEREKDLIRMVRGLSSKVHKKRRPITLQYRSAYDRKIIHMALDADDKVYTKSIGTGSRRRLMILPRKEMQRERH